MMLTDLTKMVEDWYDNDPDIFGILHAMAAEIEANRECLKSCTHDIVSLGYRIDTLKEEIEKLKIRRRRQTKPITRKVANR